MNFLSVFSVFSLILVCTVEGAVKRCFKCRSRGELGDCGNPDETRTVGASRNPFIVDREDPNRLGFSSSVNSLSSGVEAIPCSSGWCAKVIEGKGTFKADEYGLATERMCLQRPPQDLKERCSRTVRGNQEVFMCFCQGDLCNSQTAVRASFYLLLTSIVCSSLLRLF